MAVDEMGDIVNITDDERLDKPDFTAATSTLIQSTISKVLGMLVGGSGGTANPFMGCVSEPSTSWDGGTKFLTLGGAVFYQGGGAASPSTAPAGRVVVYDPTKPWQTTVTGVDLTSQAAGSQTCVIWALRGTVSADLDTRKKWAPGASAETSFSGNTRTRERISAFLATNATFNGSGQITALTAPPSTDYIPILKVTAWPAGVPTVGEISMWDGTFTGSLVGDPDTNVNALASPNLGLLVLYFRRALAYLYDNTGASNWFLATLGGEPGVKQLDDRLTDVEDLTGMGVGMSARVYKSGGSWLISVPSGYAATVNRASAGVFNITLTTYPPWGFFNTCLVQLIYAASPGTARYTRTVQASAYVFNVLTYDSSMSSVDPADEGFFVVITGHG